MDLRARVHVHAQMRGRVFVYMRVCVFFLAGLNLIGSQRSQKKARGVSFGNQDDEDEGGKQMSQVLLHMCA